MNKVKPRQIIDIKTCGDQSVTFLPDEWYEYEIFKDVSGFTMVRLLMPIDIDMYEEVQIFPNLFESVFITRQQDRDLKINDVLSIVNQ